MIEVNYNDYKRILEENMRLIPENHKLKEEVERLNNVINELEEWLKYEINKSGFEQDYERKSCYEDILDELEELKGSNSNE